MSNEFRITLGDFASLRTQTQRPAKKTPPPPAPLKVTCPTGKVPYPKEQAKQLARRFNGQNSDKLDGYNGEVLRARRCPFCNYFHIGHRR